MTSTASKPLPPGRAGRYLVDVRGERLVIDVSEGDTDATITLKLLAAISAHAAIDSTKYALNWGPW